jgi:hypothetical protein
MPHCVYILASRKHGTLYIVVGNGLARGTLKIRLIDGGNPEWDAPYDRLNG